MASNRKKSRFGVGLLIYIFLFLILSVIALIFFYDWLKAYEETRPYNSLNAYTETIAKTGPGDTALASLKEVDRSLQSEAEIKAFVADILSRTEYIRSSTLSTPEKLVYSARSDGRSIGTVSFEPSEEKRFGFSLWALASEDYDFSSYLNESTFIIPEDYQASVNGIILSRQNITSDDTQYSTLSAYYDSFPSLPHLVTYTSGKYLGQAEEAVIDRHGKTVSREEMTETVFLDTCTPPTERASLPLSENLPPPMYSLQLTSTEAIITITASCARWFQTAALWWTECRRHSAVSVLPQQNPVILLWTA